jgi:hypothetical protein
MAGRSAGVLGRISSEAAVMSIPVGWSSEFIMRGFVAGRLRRRCIYGNEGQHVLSEAARRKVHGLRWLPICLTCAPCPVRLRALTGAVSWCGGRLNILKEQSWS